MNRVFSKYLAGAGIAFLTLAGVAFGAVSPVAHWNGELTDSSIRNGFTMTFGPNAAESSGSAVLTAKTSGSETFTGVAIDWDSATFSGQTMTVLVKYSGLTQSGLTGNTALLGTYWGSSDKSTETLINATATQFKAAYGVTSSSAGQNGIVWTASLPASGMLRVTFSSSGTHITFLSGDDGGWTKAANCDQTSTDGNLKKSASFYGIKIGGSISKITSYYRPGMTVSAVAILDEDIADDDLLAFTFPPPATAWTGAARDNDPANDSNWADGDNPYASKTFTKSFQLAADADWSATAIASLNGKTAYLQGHSLKVSTFTSAAKAGTITDTTTDTTKPGTFIANVASGKTWNNPSSGSLGLVLSGNLRFVKEGAGTFIGKKTDQFYTGGTVVNAGTLKSSNAESSHYYGADGTPVTVNAGGTLDIYGKFGWHVHDVILSGGTLVNTGSGQTAASALEGLGNITLTADSKVSLKNHILVYKKAGANIDLGGHTLTVERTSSTSTVQFTLRTAAVSNGTLAFGPGIRFYTYDDNVTLGDDVKVELNGCVEWWKKYPISVGELVANSTATKDANLITVTKKFSTEGSFDNVELADGAVLDLNGNEGAFSTASGFSDRSLTFASGAKITVDIGGRTFAEGDKVISWSAKPGATFKWDSQTAKKGYPAVSREDGLYYGGGSDVIAIAHWTNASGDGDIANADNWACTNAASAKEPGALPTPDTTVYLHGDRPIAVATSVTWGGICLTGVLTADFDLSGVTSVKFSSGASFDLNGHVVKTGPISAESSAVTISDSQLATASPGALALTNGVSQLFAGLETEPGVRIRVLGGATLDLNGVNGTVFKAVLEDGSTLANTGEDSEIGSKTGETVVGGGLELAAGATATADMSSIVHFRATDDASYPIALNGGTLIKTGARVEIVNGDITGPGTIRVTASELYIGKAGARIADDVVIYVEKGGPYLWAMADVSVPNVAGEGTVKGSSYYYTVTKRFSGLLTVDGKGTKFASGMTLDLTGNKGASYAVPAKVTMLENATIAIDLAGRTDIAAGTKVVSWTTSTEPSETVRFIVDGAPYIVIRKSDGLYLLSSEGLILGVR